MKYQWLASCLLVSAASLSFAATGGDEGKTKATDCAAVAQKGECPASALIAEWEKAAEEAAAMPAETVAAVGRAQATLAASCPVCQEAPASFAFLGRFLDSTVALDERALACAGAESASCDEMPEEVRAAFAERVAIGAKSRELFAAFQRAMAPPEAAEPAASKDAADAVAAGAACHASAPAAEPTLADVRTDFVSIAEEADGLAKSWSAIPARAAALPAETKAELLAAMEVLRSEVPSCELADRTMTVLADACARLVGLDQTLGAHCDATSKERDEELPAELVEMKRAFEARAEATAKVAGLLGVMKRTMTPEIFEAEAEAETAVVRSSR